MSAILFIGSALASALLGRVFNKIIDAQEKPAADSKPVAGSKDNFQAALEQSRTAAKTGMVCKADTVSGATADSAALADSKPPAATGSMTSPLSVVDSLFSQFRFTQTNTSATLTDAPATGTHSTVGSIKNSAHGSATNSTTIIFPGSAAVDTRFDEAVGYTDPLSTPTKATPGAANDDPIGRLVTQLTVTYAGDEPKAVSISKLSTHV